MIFSLRKRKPNTKYPLQKKEFVFCSLSVYIFSFLTSIFLPLKKTDAEKTEIPLQSDRERTQNGRPGTIQDHANGVHQLYHRG